MPQNPRHRRPLHPATAVLLAAALPAKGPAMPATAPLPLIPAPRSWEADGFNLRTGELAEDGTIAVSLETRVVSLEHGFSGQVMVTI